MDKQDPSADEYIAALEQQVVLMNRQLTLQGIMLQRYEKELGIQNGGNESGNGRSDEKNAGPARRQKQNGATVSG